MLKIVIAFNEALQDTALKTPILISGTVVVDLVIWQT